MKDWFSSLDAREQKFVLAAAVFLIFAAIYLGVWMPLDKGEKRLSESVELWHTSLDRLIPLKGRFGDSSGPRISPSNLNQSLVVVVDSTLRVRQLSSTRSQPTGENIRVEFENVAFDDLILWLGDLSSQYALQVQSGSFSMTGKSNEGRVNAQLTLGR